MLTDYQNLVDEWDYERNTIDIRAQRACSAKKVWWNCSKHDHHYWQASIVNRSKQNTGCPVCRGISTCPVDQCNSLAVLQKELVEKEWDYIRNTLKPDEITPCCSKKAWWKCSNHEHHYWQASVVNRTKHNSGCPICKGLAVCPFDQCNSLAVVHKGLVKKEWDYTRNTLKPDEITPGCNKKAWWKCTTDHHVYETMINNKVRKKYNCAVCAGQQICPVDFCNSLGKFCPELCTEWHPTKNDSTPLEFTENSNKRVWWQCSKCNHEWISIIDNRSRLNRGCPCCSNKTISSDLSNSLQTLYPELAVEWDTVKNDKGPECYTVGSGYNAWWQCPVRPCHNYQATINKRTENKHGCPFCSHQRLCTTDHCNSIAVKYSQLAQEWFTEMNGRGPETHIAGGNKKVWWKCAKNQKHVWHTYPASRITLGTNCPRCKRSKLEIEFSLWAQECNINVIDEYRTKLSMHKKQLPYDFYIVDGILVELDGRQHFDPTSYYSRLGNFKENVWKDLLKTWNAVRNDLALIRISYLDLTHVGQTIEELISDFDGPLMYSSHPGTTVETVYNIHSKISKTTTEKDLQTLLSEILQVAGKDEK